MFAATLNYNGGQVWYSSNGSDWMQANPSGFGSGNWGIWSIIEFQEELYVGVGGTASIWRSPDGISWTAVITDGFGDIGNQIIGYSMLVFREDLYATTYNEATGTEIWRTSNGSDWSQVNEDGFGNHQNAGIISMIIFNDELYVGLRNYTFASSIWKTQDGTTWTQVAPTGFGDNNNFAIWGMAEYNNSLYAGTQNINGCQIWMELHQVFIPLVQK